MKNKIFYIALIILTVMVLAFPVAQQYGKYFELKPLKGVTVATVQPEFSLKTFMSGAYQAQEDKYLSENIGFREVFIRSYNQMTWSLFRKTQNKTIFINKDNWIFNDFTIKHHYGQSMYDFRSTKEAMLAKMQSDARMLALLQNVLKEYGVTCFVCLAPGKDMVCAEHVPEVKGFTRPPGIRAIDYYPYAFDSLGVNYIDFQKYYMEIKDTVSYPLYLKSSSHYSQQASVYAADTLFRYMEELSGLNIHNICIGEEYVAPTRYPDADLEDLMNLLWPIETDVSHYVKTRADNDPTAVKPRWFAVGDSYYELFMYSLPLDSYFATHHYWYYNKIVYNDPPHHDVQEVDILKELLSSDIVMIIYSPTNLFDINRRFLTRSLFELLYDDNVVAEKLENVKQRIKGSQKWYASIQQKAVNKGVSEEVALNDEARYILYSEPDKYFDELQSIDVPSCRNSRVAKVLEEINNQ